jgi:flagellin
MRELSIQSANGTYDNGNRTTMNAEVKQLVAELDRISQTTSFNGQNVLDGSLGSVTLQVGSEANQTIDLSIGKMDSKSLGGGVSGDLMGSEITDANITLAAGDVQVNGHALGAYDNATDNVEDLVAAFNSVEGISASTYLEEAATNKGSGILVAGTDTLTLTLTLGDGSSQAYAITDTDNMDELVSKINDTTGGAITASTDDEGKLVLATDTGVSLATTESASVALATGDLAATTETRLLLSSDDGSAIKIEGNATDLAALGLNERSAAGEIEGSAITSAVAFSAGDLTINGVEIGASKSSSLVDKLAAINEADAGVTATAFTSVEHDLATTDAEMTINGTTFAITAPALAAETSSEVDVIVAEINAQTANTGATAYNQGGTLVIESNAVMSVGVGAATASAAAATTRPVGIKLTSDDGTDVSVQLSQTDLSGAKARTGLLETNHSDTNSVGGSIANVDISTAKGAQQAIGIIDKALDQINSTRGDLGAVANRLDFTVSNLSNVAENVSEARSRIQDADFAQESANLSRAQVLQQAGTAMLAQANASPQQVLSLLQ